MASTSAAADAAGRTSPGRPLEWLPEVIDIASGGEYTEPDTFDWIKESANAEPLPPGWTTENKLVAVPAAVAGDAHTYESRTLYKDPDTGTRVFFKPTDPLYATLVLAIRRHAHAQGTVLDMALHIKSLVKLRLAAANDVKARFVGLHHLHTGHCLA
jgi:hypothetical protein